MPNILLIETSSVMCSVALSADRRILKELSFSDGMKHAEKLPVFVEECLQFIANENINIDAVAVSGGPGSYTGLRIGVSYAKGICYGSNIPLIAIDTLKTIAYKAKQIYNEDVDMLFPMVDARRMEVYCTVFSNDFTTLFEHQAIIIDDQSLNGLLEKGSVLLCGNGAAKCMDVISHQNVKFAPDFELSAADMADIAHDMFDMKDFADLAYYQPFYLKEYQFANAKK